MEKDENKKADDKSTDKKLPVEMIVTTEGSLGLLALGAVGIKAWRKKIAEMAQISKKS